MTYNNFILIHVPFSVYFSCFNWPCQLYCRHRILCGLIVKVANERPTSWEGIVIHIPSSKILLLPYAYFCISTPTHSPPLTKYDRHKDTNTNTTTGDHTKQRLVLVVWANLSTSTQTHSTLHTYSYKLNTSWRRKYT